MTIWENIKMATDSIFAHKLRSILTMLGIIIGVASVIIIVAIGQGGTAQLTEAFAGSSNTVNLMPKRDENAAFFIPEENVFTQKDLDDLKQISEVKSVIASSFDMANIQYRDKKTGGTFVFGVNSNVFLETSGLKVRQGRIFQSGDFHSSSGGAILSDSVAKKLFPDKDPIGEIIRVKSQPVRVIGVLQKPEGLQGLVETSEIYLPSQTWRTVFGSMKIDQVVLQVKEAGLMESAGKKAVDILNRNHNKDDGYEVQNIEQLTQGIKQVANIMTIVIGSIGGISLLVGGIGVMNIMLVSVTERTREIGIRKAMGATRGNILMQFLVESVTLSVIGGGIGILIGAGVSGVLKAMDVWPATVSIPVAIGGVLFSMLFGIVFGILPANKAARLNPIECLRYE
ncbi:ABC transporter permease [Paenactinomyces guangxiensis]|uniref:ABC transporter permease n=1 Tax=Paenactinomyces guangxiensis TaxID=1490290 RepID=A0A7W2AA73_9BACL|nr:ABC transporter permease [Paenactinomyces guangxiensis]MBA4496490.1 ABC transporter permease [Paenactinomyces guangxiensis]MBH8592858.1 ABC transporter permease [Paenactinomyces guangxiensis]